MKRSAAALLASIAAGTSLILAGCSSSGGSSSSPTTGSTNASSTTSASANQAAGPASSAGSSALAGQSVRFVSGGGEDFSDAAEFHAYGLLEAEGIKVDHSTVEDPSSALRAVVAGKADITLLDPTEAAKAVANGGASVKYIASTTQTTDYEIIALPKVSLTNLDGAKFATAGAGTAGDLIATAALQKQGVDISKIHRVTVGGTSARVTAILSGQVDLAPVLAPAAVAAVNTGKVKILLNAGDVLGSYLQQGLITSETFLKNTALVQAVVNAFIDSERWAASNASGYVQQATDSKLMGSLTATEAQAAYDQLKSGKIFATNGAVCASAVESTLQFSYADAKSGLTKANTPDTSKWVDPTFVNNYLQKNGKDPSGFC